ncbi:MAG: ORF6C domain-containing protein [Lachnospiraceae bacterium]|nr:ORF6C domain-containing protein [Lachnospiraceae bacterium]
MGCEQTGCRPCIIIQNDTGNFHSPTTIIAPMTTQRKKRLPTHVPISSDDKCLELDTVILLEQIRTVDKQRVGNYVCQLSKETMERVDKAIEISLALNKEERRDNGLNELQIFKSEKFGQIRTVQLNGETYFVGKDLAEALGYANPKNAVPAHVDEEDKLNTQIEYAGQRREITVVNESGLYALIFGSKLKSAKEFKHWVTSEVLPTIRKTGGYQQKKMAPEEMMRVQLGMIDDHESRIENLENNMTIDYGQQRVLENTVAKTVIDVLGGKQSNAYKEISKKVFAECNRDLKNHFNVNSRNDVPKIRFDEAVEYAKAWRPCTNTMLLIRDCNAQINI